jgi:hypothetical protein
MSLGFSILAIPLPSSFVRAHTRVAKSRIVSAGDEKFRIRMFGPARSPAAKPSSREPVLTHDAQILVALQQELI